MDTDTTLLLSLSLTHTHTYWVALGGWGASPCLSPRGRGRRESRNGPRWSACQLYQFVRNLLLLPDYHEDE